MGCGGSKSDTSVEPDVVDFQAVSIAVKNGKPRIFDVRNPDEFAAGHIPGAINLPLPEIWDALALEATEFSAKYGTEMPEHSEEIIVHCKSGVRATDASMKAIERGFVKVRLYKGSYLDWVANGGEVIKG